MKKTKTNAFLRSAATLALSPRPAAPNPTPHHHHQQKVQGQEAGLHVSTPGDHNIIGVRKDAKGAMQVFFSGDSDKTSTPGVALNQNDLWLQARVDQGLATFFYSLDGKTFTQLGGEERLRFFGFTPNLVGFYSMNSEEKGCLDVDWFTYEYDGPKAKR